MDKNALATLTPEQAEMIPAIVKQMMGPLVESMAKLLENNTNAMNQLAATQMVQNDRLEALEKQIRYNEPVTRQQASYLSAAIKEHALGFLDKYAISDAKAMRKLTGVIRKDVLSFWGFTVLGEIPKCEYSTAMQNIKTWNNMRVVREVVKEAREREEMDESGYLDLAQSAPGLDGSSPPPG